MISKALALAVVVAVVGVVVGVLGLSIATASEHPERSFSQAPVAPGDEVEVTITRVGALGLGFRQVVETLPEGFSYVDGSAMTPDSSGVVRYTQGATAQDVKFTVLGVSTLKYKVMVGANVADGPYTFTGVVVVDPSDTSMNVDVGGTQSIMVMATVGMTPVMTPTASPEPSTAGMRSLPSGAAAPGSRVRVTITGLDLLAGAGRVIERLPSGFSYVEDSAMSPDPQAQIRVSDSGRMVTFTVLGIDTLHYMVMVGSGAGGGPHNISGVLQTVPGTPGQTIGGQSAITVSGTAPVTGLRRALSDASVDRGDEITVTIAGIDLLTSAGRIVEKLPAGLSYVEDSASTPDAAGRIRESVDGQMVTFTLLGVDTLTYKVMVDSDATTATRSFSGVLKLGPDDAGRMIQGDSRITIGMPVVVQPTDPPDPTPRRSRGGGGGGGGGGYAPPIATATPMPTRAPVATMAPTVAPPTPIIVPTVAPPTMAPPPEPTAMPEPTAVPPMPLPPTVMPKQTVEIPTVTPTEAPTAVPPTEMPTAVPPTVAPPTDMPTAMPPTEPPAPTATTAPTVTPVAPEEGGMPTWLIIVIIIVIVAVVIAAIGFYMMRMRR